MTLEDIIEPEVAKAPGPGLSLWHGVFRAPGLGALSLLWSAEGLMALRFPPARRAEAPALPANAREAAPPTWLAGPLEDYFSGSGTALDAIPVNLDGTDFQQQVWRHLREIQPGSVQSYGSVAAALGHPRAMRAVGMANRANRIPIVVPCHRVVRAGHRLGGYSGGLARKRMLLALEGITLDGDRVLPGQLTLPRTRRSKAKRSVSGRLRRGGTAKGRRSE